MSLSLFPITALLFLLSGVGVPAHAVGPVENHAALLRVLFGFDADSAELTESSEFENALWTRWEASRAYTKLFSEAHGLTSSASYSHTYRTRITKSSLALHVPGAFTHKQYRTRFGFSNGAYQAIGPPSHGSRFDRGWYRE